MYFFRVTLAVSVTIVIIQLIFHGKGGLVLTSIDLTGTAFIRTWQTSSPPNTEFTPVMKKTIDTIYISGFAASIIALLISLFILAPERSDKRPRVVHMHFFTSLLITDSLWILLYIINLTNHEIMVNPLFCEGSHYLIMYFVLTNYIWMHCEGEFLYMSTKVVIFNEAKKLQHIRLIGWAFPLLDVIVYAIVHISVGNFGNSWMIDRLYNWIFNMPLLTSLYMSVAYVFRILYLVQQEYQWSFGLTIVQNVVAMLRAALLVVLLVGLYIFLFQWVPSENTVLRNVYEVLVAIFMGYQGLFLAVGLCFSNQAMMQDVNTRLWRCFSRVLWWRNGRAGAENKQNQSVTTEQKTSKNDFVETTL